MKSLTAKSTTIGHSTKQKNKSEIHFQALDHSNVALSKIIAHHAIYGNMVIRYN